MNTTFLSLFFPKNFQTLYYFIDGGADFFTLEYTFLAQDFLYIDFYNHHFSGKDILEELQAFLVQLNEKEVQWLLCLPDNRMIRGLFRDFNILYQAPNLQHPQKIPILYIVNYPV